MEYVYYCMDCKKFFFLESDTKPALRAKCKHCNGVYAVDCCKTKEEYNLLTEDEKVSFKSNIKDKYKTMTDVYELQEELKREKEKKHIEYAKSLNEFYEYDVVTIINEEHGAVNKEKMVNILSEYAKKGWRLHTIYSNELGKNAVSVLGAGTNATACEDVLIFERRVARIDD